MIQHLLLFLACVVAVCMMFIANCGALSAVERSALVDLYYATNGMHWKRRWNVNNPNSDPCSDWSGVWCRSDGSGYQISLHTHEYTDQGYPLTVIFFFFFVYGP